MPLWLGTFVYLLLVTLHRGGYRHDTHFTIAELALYAVLPLVPGLLSKRRELVVVGMLVASMLPTQKVAVLVYAAGLFVLLITLRNRDVRTRLLASSVARVYMLFMAYVVVIWLVNLGGTTDAWSLPLYFATALVIPSFYVLLFHGLAWTDEQRSVLLRGVVMVLSAQAAVTLVYPVLCDKPELYLAGVKSLLKGLHAATGIPVSLPDVDPDWNRATMVDAHVLGFVLALLSAYFAAEALRQRSPLKLALAVLVFYLFCMTEATHLLPGVLTGYGLIALVHRFRSRGFSPLHSASIVLVAMISLQVVSVLWLYGPNRRFTGTNKARFYSQTAVVLLSKPLSVMFGQGPSSYGSRAANKRLPGEEHRVDAALPEWIRQRAGHDYVTALRMPVGATRGNTLESEVSGIIALVGEFGVVGVALLALLVYRITRQQLRPHPERNKAVVISNPWCAVFPIVLLSSGLVFRQYLEYPQVMVFAALFILEPGRWWVVNHSTGVTNRVAHA